MEDGRCPWALYLVNLLTLSLNVLKSLFALYTFYFVQRERFWSNSGLNVRERYMDNRKRWWYRISDEQKLTEEDIDKFVKVTSYIVLDFYLDLSTCGFVLKNLAAIRPNCIIPAVMEKYTRLVLQYYKKITLH